MNRFIVFVFILLINITFLPAQTDQLQVSVAPLSGSETDREMIIDWQASVQLSEGILIQLPQGVKAVPVSIRINDAEMWLKNGEAPPERDSVVVWQLNADGLVLLFDNGLLTNGDRLLIRSQASIPVAVPESNTIQIREVNVESDQLISGDQVLASGILQISQEN